MNRDTRSRRNRMYEPTTRIVALMVILGLVRSSAASPGDVTNIPAPVLGADAPKAEALRAGDASVATQTGALEYSYPITVPPGRLGNEPHLALSYSSQAPTYGTIAAGWSLSIPEIRWDTSKGILATHYMDILTDGRADDQFVSTLAGSRPLVAVTEPTSAGVYKTYRAQNDTSFTRYERMDNGQPFAWRAYTPEGLTYIFGDTNLIAGVPYTDHVPLTRTIDQYGNTVEYQWNVTGDYQIAQIRYTSNPAASLPAFAKVDFTWTGSSYCGSTPAGSQLDYRFGTEHVMGTSRLTRITTTAIDPVSSNVLHTRQVTLAYSADSEDCGSKHGPIRYLASIQESAWGASTPRVDLPAVRFQYGASYADLTVVDQSYGRWNTAGNELPTNLGWGYRYNDHRWPSVQAMMIDFDGDGLVDRLSMDPSGACQFRWLRNTGSGFQQVGDWISLPQLPKVGGNPDEKCSLDGMFSEYSNVPTGSVNCPPNSGLFGGGIPSGSYLAYRWMDMNGDGLPDLVTAIHHDPDGYDPAKPGDTPYAWPSCSADPACAALDSTCMSTALDCGAGFDGQPCLRNDAVLSACLGQAQRVSCNLMMQSGPESAGGSHSVQSQVPNQCTAPFVPFELCQGKFPWIIYWNQGNGVLASAPDIRLQPVPLESDTGDSSIGPGSFSANSHAFQDIDGDGNIDAIVQARFSDDPDPLAASPKWWEVFRGDGHGNFLRSAGNVYPYIWFVPEGANPGFSQPHPGSTSIVTDNVAQLTDMNGDGLPDYVWKHTSGAPAQVFYNMGNQMQFGGYDSATGTWSYATALDSQIGALARSLVQITKWQNSGSWPAAGTRTGKSRLADVDGDGRVDLFDVPCADPMCSNYLAAVVRPNAGGVFLPGLPASNAEATAMQQTAALVEVDQGVATWEVDSDYSDLDGDGLPEWVAFDGNGNLVRVTQPKSGHPLRLLNQIDNGRGLAVSVNYAPTTDSTTVTQDATTRRASPRIQYVVKDMLFTDRLSPVSSTVRYHYDYPHFGPDDAGRYSFRGFDAVHTYSGTNAETLQRYGYDVDWSGRLTATTTMAAEAPGLPLKIAETTWTAKTLFGGTVTTYHPQTTRDWTCANGQTEAQCKATPAGFTKQESTWTAMASTTATGGPALLWQETGKTLQDSEVFDNGDRRTDTTYALAADTVTYRLRDLVTTSKQQVAGVLTPYAVTAKTYDGTYRLPATEEVNFDNVANNRAITTKAYDTVGNLTTLWKPMQRGTTKKTVYAYDSRKLFVDTATNELGQVTRSVYDYGTGALLRTIGPNVRSCTSGCGTQTTEERRTDVDGLGRPVATWVTTDTANGDYQLAQVGKMSYVDTFGSGPTSIQVETLIEYDDTRWTKEKTYLDGHGRPFLKTSYVQGSAPADATTSFSYNEIGKLISASVPDPSQNSDATVTYTYGYDSLGRPTSMRRPGATPLSGVDVTYNGLVETRTEIAGASGGPAGATETTNDAFGRMTLVRERLAPGIWAPTAYHYDARDNVDQVTDPEGLVTYLDHDFASRRVGIRRGARTWSYVYDKNGNLTSEASPPPSALLAPLYTTTYAYDDLDRVRSRLVGTRGMTATDLDLLGIGQLVYTYDTGTNSIGRLHSVVTQSTSSTPVTVLTTTLSYDAEGNSSRDDHAYNLGGVTGTFTRSTTYAPGGKPRLLNYGDGLTATSSTQSRTFYDNRALPSKLEVYRPGYSTTTFGNQTRNVAGLVTRRQSAVGSTTYNSDWTYDSIGRIGGLAVTRSPGAQIVSQSFNYYGLDDPSSMAVQYSSSSVPPSGLSKTFTYSYDTRHQLTNVSESGGALTGTYTFKNSGRFDRVTMSAAALPGSDVKSRDVYYEYNGSDPEAVSRLRKVDGTDFATYQYDTVGNQTSRTYASPAQSWAFTYDGDDQLRRSALTGGGREEYYYDHTGSRVGIVKRTSAGAISEVRYFIGGDTEIWLSPTGTVNQTYAYASIGTPVARISNRNYAELEFHSPLSNLLASIDPATATTGAVSSAFVYAPYSELVQTYQGTTPTGDCAGLGPVSCHRRRFNDKYVDEVDALSYYGVRYYDPASISWTQGDPLFRFAKDGAWNQPRRANLYQFDLQNPLRFVDPDGRNPGWARTAVGELGAFSTSKISWIAESTLKAIDITQRVTEEVATIPYKPFGILLNTISMKSDQSSWSHEPAKDDDDGNSAMAGPPPGGGGGGLGGGGLGGGGLGGGPLAPEVERGIRNLEKQIAKHEEKIAQELAKDSPDQGLIGHWRKEIDTFKKNIEKYRDGTLKTTPRGTGRTPPPDSKPKDPTPKDPKPKDRKPT